MFGIASNVPWMKIILQILCKTWTTIFIHNMTFIYLQVHESKSSLCMTKVSKLACYINKLFNIYMILYKYFEMCKHKCPIHSKVMWKWLSFNLTTYHTSSRFFSEGYETNYDVIGEYCASILAHLITWVEFYILTFVHYHFGLDFYKSLGIYCESC